MLFSNLVHCLFSRSNAFDDELAEQPLGHFHQFTKFWNVPEVFESQQLKRHSGQELSQMSFVNHETSSQTNQLSCVFFSISCN